MKCTNYKVDNKILDICKNEFPYFLNKSNVVGLGMSYKVKNGVSTDIKCIKVLVTSKLSPNRLLCSDIIPKCYKDIPTDVVESGIIKSASLTQRVRPVVGGYSIGPSSIPEEVGSVGCLVTDGHNKYFLGNNHVLADGNFASIHSAIVQPSIYDGGIIQSDTVGTLAGYSQLQYKTFLSTPDNYVDCAIVKLTTPNIATSDIAFMGKPHGTSQVQLKQNVQKVGRTTEQTYGRVAIVGATIETQFKRGRLLFKEQIATNIMTNFGDSGALLCDLMGFGVGLFFAQSNTFSYHNPINYVLDALNVHMVTD